MELTYDLVKKGNLRILGVSGIYPSKDNCYKVDVTLPHKTAGEISFIDNYCPKPVYHIWKKLSELSTNISDIDLGILIDSINEYGSWKYDEADNDNAMCEAGGSL